MPPRGRLRAASRDHPPAGLRRQCGPHPRTRRAAAISRPQVAQRAARPPAGSAEPRPGVPLPRLLRAAFRGRPPHRALGARRTHQPLEPRAALPPSSPAAARRGLPHPADLAPRTGVSPPRRTQAPGQATHRPRRPAGARSRQPSEGAPNHPGDLCSQLGRLARTPHVGGRTAQPGGLALPTRLRRHARRTAYARGRSDGPTFFSSQATSGRADSSSERTRSSQAGLCSQGFSGWRW